MTIVESFRAQLYAWPQRLGAFAPLRVVNGIDEDEVVIEVGDENWARVRRAIADTYAGESGILLRSTAPSIVTRGEVEMHGLSYPRFAFRLHLKGGGFIHVRRLALLLKLLPKPLASGQPERILGKQRFRSMSVYDWEDRFIDEYRSPIADCALVPPKALRTGFNFLRADLGRAYGESSFEAVPYVQMMAHFGGAACVQACMLMSGLIASGGSPHGDEVASVHGPAEMALSVGVHDGGWLSLNGLYLEDAVACLAASGYGAAQHEASHYAAYDAPQFAERMASFVDAQVPVICSVNSTALRAGCYGEHALLPRPVGRFARVARTLRSVLRRHPGAAKGAADVPRRNDHAVVVIGASRDRTRFVINDPSYKPFCVVDPAALRRASVGARFCAVYPPGVKLGLYEGFYSFGQVPRRLSPGVYEMASHVHRTRNAEFDFGATGPHPDDFGQFFLARLMLGASVRLSLANGLALGKKWVEKVGEPELAAALQRLPAAMSGLWVWLHVQDDPRRLSVWLAEKEVTCLECLPYVAAADAERAIATHLLAVLQSSGRNAEWTPLFINTNFKRPNDEAVDAMGELLRDARSRVTPGLGNESTFQFGKGPRPEVTLVSSFCAKGVEEAFAGWPAALCKSCELYSFMHHDAKLFEAALPSVSPPVEWLAAYGDAAGRRTRAAAFAPKVVNLAAARHPELRIKALATFFPEIAGKSSEKVVRALAALVDFARELKVRGHAVRTIELVAGNRIEGVQPYRDDDNEVVCFAKVRETLAMTPLGPRHATVDVLAEVVRETKLDPAEQLTFAVELEPGKVFAIHGMPGVRDLLAAVDAHPDAAALQLHRIIGLNLDVGHFALAGIKPDDITPSERKRIAHVHFSDHRVGHLADLQLGFGELGTRRGIAAFDPWLELVRDTYAAGRGEGDLPLSGLVSLELEATRSLAEVEASLNQMRRWF